MARYFDYSIPPAVKSVTVRCKIPGPWQINVVRMILDDADQTNVVYAFRLGFPSGDQGADLTAIGLVDLDDLLGPLQNADGDTVDIIVRGFPYGTTRASLVEFGLFDPFSYQSFVDWKNHRKYRSVEIHHPPTITEDAVSQRRDVAFGYGMKPEKSVSQTGAMAQSLADIDAYYLPLSSGDRFVLRLIAPAGTAYSQGMEIAEDQRLRGLISGSRTTPSTLVISGQGTSQTWRGCRR